MLAKMFLTVTFDILTNTEIKMNPASIYSAHSKPGLLSLFDSSFLLPVTTEIAIEISRIKKTSLLKFKSKLSTGILYTQN